jgi:hypothetical protein
VNQDSGASPRALTQNWCLCATRQRATGYADHGAGGVFRFGPQVGVRIVQTAQPRDVAALALVVGMFLILFIVSLMLGTPAR